MAAGRFRYALEPLLKKRRSERDASAAQERSARGLLKAHTEQARAAALALSGVESALRESLQAGASIDPRRQEALSGYLAVARDALRAKSGHAAKAGELHEQTQRALLRALQEARALELHRENRQREHRRERRQLAEHKQDELWLTRRRSPWR